MKWRRCNNICNRFKQVGVVYAVTSLSLSFRLFLSFALFTLAWAWALFYLFYIGLAFEQAVYVNACIFYAL